MLINLRNAMMSGKRTPSVTDYASFSNSAFFFDAIDNAGIGVHADTLPVAFGFPQWKNIAPMASTFAHNTDLDVSGMTPSAKSMEFTSGDAWAAWGGFNTNKISQDDATAILNNLFNDITVTPNVTKQYTCEIVFGVGQVPTTTCTCMAGYNERAIYYVWGTPSSTNTQMSLRFGENRNGTDTQVFQGLGSFDIGVKHIAFSQGDFGMKIWMNGVRTFTRTLYPATRFWRNMVSLKRGNSVSTNVAKGSYFRLTITPELLTDAEIAADYAIDKERFNLP